MSYFNHLANFLTVFDLKSITSAADILNLTPSSVTKQMKALERRLGCKLFEKDGRNIQPTNFAKDLAFRIRKSIGTLKSSLENQNKTIIRLFVDHYILSNFYDKIFLTLLNEGINIEIHYTFKHTSELLYHIQNDTIDFAVTRTPDGFKDIATIPLFKEYCKLITSSDNKGCLDNNENSILNFINDSIWVSKPHIFEKYHTYRYLKKNFDYDFKPKKNIVVAEDLTINNFLKSSKSFAVIPSRYCHADIEAGHLIDIHPNRVQDEYDIFLSYKKDNEHIPIYQKIIQIFEKYFPVTLDN